jgi:hypothetical protein
MTQPEKVEYILSKSAEYFGVDKKEFADNCSNKSKLWGKKRYVSVILDEHTALSRKDISELMGYKDASNISYLIKTAKENLSGELYGSPKANMIYNELLTYLNL